MQLLVRQVDAHLLEAVALEILEAEYVEQADRIARVSVNKKLNNKLKT